MRSLLFQLTMADPVKVMLVTFIFIFIRGIVVLKNICRYNLMSFVMAPEMLKNQITNEVVSATDYRSQ